ncbi:unnamed protein product [Lactuca saligna]|uniref:Uncharacterized protein n=1 Tax=Lactuca saligna TaxID=75948 RepID=A0AA35VUB0_LACSI|nr:unnamed protein product [Lactuca saligna]
MVAKFNLRTHSVFPPWTMERIHNEAIDNLSLHWLELLVSFDLVNLAESQFDFPVTPRAFLFRCFEHIDRAPLSYYEVNNMLFSFYIKFRFGACKIWLQSSFMQLFRLRTSQMSCLMVSEDQVVSKSSSLLQIFHV